MKIRSGYISNSSSSSFIIFGKNIGDIYCLPELDFDNKTYYLVGNNLCDGIDLIELTKELYDYFVAENIEFEQGFNAGDIIECHHLLQSNETMFISFQTPVGLPADSETYVVETDYHSTKDLKTAQERYCANWKKYKKGKKK